MIKKILTIVFLLTVNVSAQSVRWQTFRQSVAASDADTSYFALRVGFFAREVAADSNSISPPENTVIDETPVATFRQVAGTASDSSITYAKPVIIVGGVARIVQNDSAFVAGSTFAAPSTPNTFGDGRLYAKTLAFNLKRFNGVVFITKVFDTVGGARRFEYGLGTQ